MSAISGLQKPRTSPAQAGEGVITEDDLATLQRIVRAFEARFVDWYLAQPQHYRAGREENVEALQRYAERFSFDYIDEDGTARFSQWSRGDDDDREDMPFSAILGTTEEFVERMREERNERLRKQREALEQQRREAEERKQREAEAAERKRLAERERIFREECKARGIDYREVTK